jgi:hypothetical protein
MMAHSSHTRYCCNARGVCQRSHAASAHLCFVCLFGVLFVVLDRALLHRWTFLECLLVICRQHDHLDNFPFEDESAVAAGALEVLVATHSPVVVALGVVEHNAHARALLVTLQCRPSVDVEDM